MDKQILRTISINVTATQIQLELITGFQTFIIVDGFAIKFLFDTIADFIPNFIILF